MKKILIFTCLSSLLASLAGFIYPTLNLNRIQLAPVYTRIHLQQGNTYDFKFKVRSADRYQLNLEYRKNLKAKSEIFDPGLKLAWSLHAKSLSKEDIAQSLPLYQEGRNLSLVNLSPSLDLKPHTEYKLKLNILNTSSHLGAKTYLELSVPPTSFAAYYEKYESWYIASMAFLCICMLSFTMIVVQKPTEV